MSNRNKRWKDRAHSAPVDEMFVRALLNDEDQQHSDRKPFDPRQDRKTLQLCRQVQRALMLALAGECTDDLLLDVYVESVLPIDGPSQLLVRIALPNGSGLRSSEVLARLNDRAPKLRAIIAQSICRKRVPNLFFVAVHTSPDAHEGSQQP